jgi:hypothetical protein
MKYRQEVVHHSMSVDDFFRGPKNAGMMIPQLFLQKVGCSNTLFF